MNFLNKIGEKISEAFSIFDLTYFISGLATCLIILLHMQIKDELHIFFLIKEQLHWILWIVIIYIAGLISFSIGRIIRQYVLFQKFTFYTLFGKLYTEESYHKTDKIYFFRRLINLQHKKTARKQMDRKYTELWTLVRHEEKYKPTYEYICKYWITSAIYEGLLFSSILTMMLFYDRPFYFWGAIICALACIVEARRSTDIIIKDVIVCTTNRKEER